MCTGENHRWFATKAHMAFKNSSKAGLSLSRLHVGGDYILTVQPKHDAVQGVWETVIMFLSQVLRKVYGSQECVNE